MIIRPVKLTVSLTNIINKKCFVFYHLLIQGGEAPLYNYVVKYKALPKN